jgi:hypothetical protein
VQQGAGDAQDNELGTAEATPQHRCSETHADDPDVLDGVIGKEAFEIVLTERVGNTEDAGNHSRADEHVSPPEGGNLARCREAHEPVDPHLDQHAGHERGDVAGSIRMRAGQPDMERHDAGLEAEAAQPKDEDGIAGRRGERRWPTVHVQCLRGRAKERKHREQAECAKAGGQEIHVADLAHPRLLVLRADEHERRERHDLPACQEQHRVPGDDEEEQPAVVVP